MLALGELVSLCPSVAFAQHYVAQLAEAHHGRKFCDATRSMTERMQAGGNVRTLAVGCGSQKVHHSGTQKVHHL